MTPPTIAIIGGGFSGSMVAYHLLRQSHPITIKLIERRPVMGHGIAYETPWDCHLLNVPAGKMSALPDVPTHFLRWLHTQSGRSTTAETFVSRKLYGRYIQALLAEAHQQALPHQRLDFVGDEALTIDFHAKRCVISLASGATIDADQVVLAIGNFPPSDPAVAERSFYRSQRYVRSGWLAATLSLPADDSVLLVGSGLTALDTVLALHQQGHRGTIHLLSRHGLLPQAHQSVAPNFLPWDFPSPLTTRCLVRAVRQAVERSRLTGQDWRSVVDSLRPFTQALWQALSLAEQRRFLRHVRPYWEVHRHRVAPTVATAIAQLLHAQQVVVHSGRIQAYEEDADGVAVCIRCRSSGDSTSIRVQTVINCTGSQGDYRQIAHPLIQTLLRQGAIQPDPLGLGLQVAANGALINSTGMPSRRLYTLGSAQKGCLWETTAVPELRQQAIALAQTMLHSLETSKQIQAARSNTSRADTPSILVG